MSIHYSKGFEELSPQYHTYIFDIWGVIHNGIQLFPGVLETLRMLKTQGKQICFLSNSPRAGGHHERFFESLRLTRDLYEFVYTSGDGLLDGIVHSSSISLNDPFFFMGDEVLHQPVWQSMPGERVPLLEEAKYILCAAPMDGAHRVLQKALPLGIPLICANPDRAAIKGDTKVACAGSIAYDYEQMGGQVVYCGKPEPFIYENLFKKLGHPALESMLAVGDGLFTDIKGANGMGIDSVFIHGGLHSAVAFPELEEWFAIRGITPQYVMSSVQW
jgi:HAD superfamily hydrolase (TIGR01459 family)